MASSEATKPSFADLLFHGADYSARAVDLPSLDQAAARLLKQKQQQRVQTPIISSSASSLSSSSLSSGSATATSLSAPLSAGLSSFELSRNKAQRVQASRAPVKATPRNQQKVFRVFELLMFVCLSAFVAAFSSSILSLCLLCCPSLFLSASLFPELAVVASLLVGSKTRHCPSASG